MTEVSYLLSFDDLTGQPSVQSCFNFKYLLLYDINIQDFHSFNSYLFILLIYIYIFLFCLIIEFD